jgi:8-oxo-dGTP pyrophosphatase MutT (NUDIX family)
MKRVVCSKGCCKLQLVSYNGSGKIDTQKSYSKAGIIIYDPKSDKILIVQSRGNLWGPPKGSANGDEHPKDCAIREVQEETGIKVIAESLSNKVITLSNRVHYFYTELPECEVCIQPDVLDNDASGIGWVHLACLKEFMDSGIVNLTKHCEILLNRIFRF